MFEPPTWMNQRQQQKPLTLEELKEKRRRLVEMQKIRKLEQRNQDLNKTMLDKGRAEREARIRALKQMARGGVKVLQAGRNKLGDFERKKASATPRGLIPKKKIYSDAFFGKNQ